MIHLREKTRVHGLELRVGVVIPCTLKYGTVPRHVISEEYAAEILFPFKRRRGTLVVTDVELITAEEVGDGCSAGFR